MEESEFKAKLIAEWQDRNKRAEEWYWRNYNANMGITCRHMNGVPAWGKCQECERNDRKFRHLCRRTWIRVVRFFRWMMSL